MASGWSYGPRSRTITPRLRAILATPEVAGWWGPVPDGFPTDDDPAATRLSIVLEGRVAGLIQLALIACLAEMGTDRARVALLVGHDV